MKTLVFSIFGILGLALLVIVFLVAAAAKNGSIKGGDEEEMIKHIYVYLVLFVTLMMTIGGSVAAFMAIADIVSPTPYYQSFEDYKFQLENRYEKPSLEISDREAPKLSEEEMRVRYQAQLADERARQVSRAKNSLIKSLGWIVIPFPIFLYWQWRLRKKKEAA